MIVLFRPIENEQKFQPIVIIDYTRSDEQYSAKQIADFVGKAAPKPTAAQFTPLVSSLPGTGIFSVFIPSIKPTLLPAKIYSLDYSMSFTHRGLTYGDSLKTEFYATIKNAPTELVSLLNIQQYTSEQNITALKRAINNVLDPQVKFPTGKFFIKTGEGSDLTLPRKRVYRDVPAQPEH